MSIAVASSGWVSFSCLSSMTSRDSGRDVRGGRSVTPDRTGGSALDASREAPPRTARNAAVWLRFAAALFRLPRSAGRRHLPGGRKPDAFGTLLALGDVWLLGSVITRIGAMPPRRSVLI